VAAIIWTALLVAAAVIPADRMTLPPGTDLWSHGIGYGIHAFLTCLAVSDRRPGRHAVAIAAGAAIALGAVTEGLQSFVPGRDPSLADGVADAVGALIGAAIGRGTFGRDRDR